MELRTRIVTFAAFIALCLLFPIGALGQTTSCVGSDRFADDSLLLTLITSKVNRLVSKGEFGSLSEARESIVSSLGVPSRKLLATDDVSIYRIATCKTSEDPRLFFEGEQVGFLERNPTIIGTEIDDPIFNLQWGLESKEDFHIDALDAWRIETGSPEVVIAVTDSGVDYNSPELSHKMWKNDLEIPSNGIDDDNNGYVDDVFGIDTINHTSNPFDDNGHGSCNAGIAAAQANNGYGMAGASHHSKVMALKALDKNNKGDHAHAIEALGYILSMKARNPEMIIVSSNSWGDSDYSEALYETVREMNEAGILFVAAAGNTRGNADFPASRMYPASLDLPNVISVAAHGKQGNRASFTTFGAKRVHLSAPGAGIYSMDHQGGFSINSGTSMAAPHVSGTAALLLAQNSALDPVELKSVILQSARYLPSMSGRVLTDGRLSAYGALALIRGEVLVTQDPHFEKEVLEGETVQVTSRFKQRAGDVKWSLFSHEGISTNVQTVEGNEEFVFEASLSMHGKALAASAKGKDGSEALSRKYPINVRARSLGAKTPSIPSAIRLFDSAVKAGEHLRLSVPRSLVDGTGPFRYRWYLNNKLIDGESNDHIAIGPLSLDDSGSNFSVEVVGPTGLTTGSSATVTVYDE